MAAILGLDPMFVANEGKLVVLVRRGEADAVLEAMRVCPLGTGAAVIGECVEDHPRMVVSRTTFGGPASSTRHPANSRALYRLSSHGGVAQDPLFVVAKAGLVVLEEDASDQVAPTANAGLLEDAFEVLLHGVLRDHERLSDLAG